MIPLDYIIFFSITLLLTALACGLLKFFLNKRGILDTPNDRSSHDTPTPKGGGLAVIPIILITWGMMLNWNIESYKWLFLFTALLACVSWADDLRGLTVTTRLMFQFLAVIAVLFTQPNTFYFHNLLPLWLDNACAAIVWVWFINLFNFMDGIDGISATESSSIGIGIILIFFLEPTYEEYRSLALPITAASLGFILWNWQPAKLFLGDVGSIPMGFLLGWLLLNTLASPLWPAAIILPLYYLADATITLFFRVWQRKKLWLAHREHFYQKAIHKGYSHARISLTIAANNILLIFLAINSIHYLWFSLVSALVCVSALLISFHGFNKKRSS